NVLFLLSRYEKFSTTPHFAVVENYFENLPPQNCWFLDGHYLTTPEFKRLFENHPSIRVTTELADDLMNVKGSSVHISKVIMNLVGNAAEAMPAGGTIRVSTRNRYLDMAIDRYERIPEGEYVMLEFRWGQTLNCEIDRIIHNSRFDPPPS
ncbi:MAG: hypothetical protein HGJ94_16830, partial [Desulfosarcina sp.]|nr:hypothetical protein [Desulfosarcina sp.]